MTAENKYAYSKTERKCLYFTSLYLQGNEFRVLTEEEIQERKRLEKQKQEEKQAKMNKKKEKKKEQQGKIYIPIFIMW